MCCFFLSFLHIFFFFCSYIQKQNTRPYFIFFVLLLFDVLPSLKKNQNYHHPSFNDDLKEKNHMLIFFFCFVFFPLLLAHIYVSIFLFGFCQSWACCLYLSIHRLFFLLSKTTKQ